MPYRAIHRISRGTEERADGNSRGSTKKEIEFPGVMKKKSYEISIGLGLQSWNFHKVSYKLAENYILTHWSL